MSLRSPRGRLAAPLTALGLGGALSLGLGLVAGLALGGRFDLPLLIQCGLGGLGLLSWLMFQAGQLPLRQLGPRISRASTLVLTLALASLPLLGSLLSSPGSGHRLDLSSEGVFTLSPASVAAVKALDQPASLLAFYGGAERQVPRLETLAQQYAAQNSKLRFQLIDPARHPELVEKHKISLSGARLALVQGSRALSIARPDEESITNGLRRLVQTEPKVVYLSTGHGELSLGDTETPGATLGGLAPLGEAFAAEGLLLKPLALGSALQVPRDASAVLVAGPKRALLAPESATLERYLNRGGHLMVLLDAGRDSGLDALLTQRGIQPAQGQIVDPEGLGPRLGVGPTVVTVHRYAKHPITQTLAGFTIFPTVRPLLLLGQPGQGRPLPLAISSAGAWAESSNTPPYLRDADEVGGELCVMALATGDAHSAPPSALVATPHSDVSSQGYRLLVAGDSQWITEPWLDRLSNRDLILNSLAWLTDQGEHLSLRPTRRSASSLYLTRRQGTWLRLVSVDLIPTGFGLLGLMIVLHRRRRVERSVSES